MVSAILKTLQAENIWTISQHCPTEISFFTLRPSNVLIFPASVKLVPTCAGLLGTQLVLMRFGRYETQDSILRILFCRFLSWERNDYDL